MYFVSVCQINGKSVIRTLPLCPHENYSTRQFMNNQIIIIPTASCCSIPSWLMSVSSVGADESEVFSDPVTKMYYYQCDNSTREELYLLRYHSTSTSRSPQ